MAGLGIGGHVPRERSARTIRRFNLYGWPQSGPGADEEDYPERDAWPPSQQLRIGTSGWAYPHWKGRFYPASCPTPQYLAWYARRLPTIEVNCTYYRLPAQATFAKWRDATPPGFRFTVKAPGAITHEKRLVDVEEDLAQLLLHARELRGKLDVLLFQFPPSFKADALPQLAAFLDLLPRDVRCAFELRHRSWYERDVYLLLAQHERAFVVHDYNKKGTPLVETAPFVYLRLHGPSGRYRGSYDVATLFQWAMQAREWMERGFEVYTYFNNDERGHGPRNAAAFRELAGGRAEVSHPSDAGARVEA
ncbi:MAG TPA: DUF72 domain-containing protein [Candidatus Thermoplasmatota archaeon]|nr:DUF72 domain-containing protein [Candidatus Thermoplasmatota archaeon]